MDTIVNPFSADAFKMASLTAAFNEIPHVPGRAGELVFKDVGAGVNTIKVAIERQGELLELIQTTQRGAPAPQETMDKRQLLSFDIPHIKLEETLHAASFQSVRAFGTNDEVGYEMMINQQLKKQGLRHDMTLEHHRLGALKGLITDADGSTLVDLYAEFEFLNTDGQPEPETFDFDLANPIADIRTKCHAVTRAMKRSLKMLTPSTALVWAFCGDDFFDAMLAHPNVKDAYSRIPDAAQMLATNFAYSHFEHGGIVWENYRGTDDGLDELEGGTIGIAQDEARLFFVGVPGLYQELWAPANFFETINTPGLPRYAKVALDPKFQEFAELHTQSNPLPLCLRPQTLMRATA